jgi:hypothetical protein
MVYQQPQHQHRNEQIGISAAKMEAKAERRGALLVEMVRLLPIRNGMDGIGPAPPEYFAKVYSLLLLAVQPALTNKACTLTQSVN